jgi:hypothetical protein
MPTPEGDLQKGVERSGARHEPNYPERAKPMDGLDSPMGNTFVLA